MKDLCRYISNFENEAHAKYKNQVVYSTLLVFFKNVFQYISSIQPSLFQGLYGFMCKFIHFLPKGLRFPQVQDICYKNKDLAEICC
ncbi:hypothetical protein FKM82_020421 [Ascaphus truei]